MSQKLRVKIHLKSGKAITSMEAFYEYKITRLAAIIYILRVKEKIPIETIRVKGRGKKWWAVYVILPTKLDS